MAFCTACEEARDVRSTAIENPQAPKVFISSASLEGNGDRAAHDGWCVALRSEGARG